MSELPLQSCRPVLIPFGRGVRLKFSVSKVKIELDFWHESASSKGIKGNLSQMMYSSINSRQATQPQNRQLIVDYSLSKYQVDCSVGELTFWN